MRSAVLVCLLVLAAAFAGGADAAKSADYSAVNQLLTDVSDGRAQMLKATMRSARSDTEQAGNNAKSALE